MDITQMRYFLVMAEELHYSRAAARLRIAQPALSQHILRIEREIGATLFDRNSRHVRLTSVGEVFRAEAALAVEQADRAVAAARRAGRGLGGELRLGVDDAVPSGDLLAVLRLLRTAAPAVRPVLVEQPGTAQVNALRRRQLHLGLFWAGPDVRDLDNRVWRHGEWGVAAAADSPLWRDVPTHRAAVPWALAAAARPLLLPPESAAPGAHQLLRWLASETGTTARTEEAASVKAALVLAASGVGLALAPRPAPGADGVRWAPVVEARDLDAPGTSLHLAWPQVALAPVARQLLDLLADEGPAAADLRHGDADADGAAAQDTAVPQPRHAVVQGA